MERFKIFVSIVALFVMLMPRSSRQWQPPLMTPHPLCASQIALANYACALLPFVSVQPTTPLSPPLPPDDESGHHHHHRHHHRHNHREKRSLSPTEENCCRWVQEVDSECVCELLSHLPAFLERPRHNYTITVGESCDVTYSCGGGIRL